MTPSLSSSLSAVPSLDHKRALKFLQITGIVCYLVRSGDLEAIKFIRKTIAQLRRFFKEKLFDADFVKVFDVSKAALG